jgi:16S rRNA (cytidine1402-2'-O)-methyltransferase
MDPESMLYIVSTPIGNLGDMSLRAIETLRSVDYVVSEDTRKTGVLLKHFDIHKPQISFREDNEKRTLPKLMGLLNAGNHIAWFRMPVLLPSVIQGLPWCVNHW